MHAWWEYSCSCGLAGWGPSPDAAKKEFRSKDLNLKREAIEKKRQAGEALTRTEQRIVAYSPGPFGTAASDCTCS